MHFFVSTMVKTVFIILTVLLGAFSAVADEHSGSVTCEIFRKNLPRDFVSGFVEALESSDSGSPRLHVFYYGYLNSKGPIPVVVFNGGPGSESHSIYDLFWNQTKFAESGVDEKPNVIFIDQRGTGCSSPYPTDFRRLKYYGSTEIARDAELVRSRLLAEKSWIVFGQSFGGTIAARYVEQFPKHVSRLVTVGFAPESDAIRWLHGRAMAQSRVNRTYFSQYPEDVERLVHIRDSLKGVCLRQDDFKVCGSNLADAFIFRLESPASYLDFHTTLVRINASGSSVNTELLMSTLRDLIFNTILSEITASEVITKVEWGFSTRSLCQSTEAQFTGIHEMMARAPLFECRFFKSLKWAKSRMLRDLPVDTTKMLNLKTLRSSFLQNSSLTWDFMIGSLDPFSAAEASNAVKNIFNNGFFKDQDRRVNHLIAPNEGHDYFYNVWLSQSFKTFE